MLSSEPGLSFTAETIRQLEAVDQRWVPGWSSRPGMPTELAYVAEAPGREEIRNKIALSGPSGDINWQFAQRYGHVTRQGTWGTALKLEGGYVTNWRKIPISKFEKDHITDEEIAAWTADLEIELAAVAPKVVVALGGYAVSALLGPGHSLFWTNGVSFQRQQGDFVVIPVVHPAAGMHDSDMLARTSAGYEGVLQFLDGHQSPRMVGSWHPDPRTDIVSTNEISQWPAKPSVGLDTEGSPSAPFCLTGSFEAGKAWLIYATDKEAIAAWVAWMHKHRPVIYLHNSIYDATVIRNMTGLNVWDFEVRDTMVASFNLQDLPIGLKPLTMRELNIHMDEYEDVVRPWKMKADRAWLTRGYERAMGALTLEQQFTPKGRERMSHGQPVFKWTGPELMLKFKNHVEREQNISLAEEKWAEAQVGQSRPGMDLKLVPPEIHVPYAGKDAAVTLSHGPFLFGRVEREGLKNVADLDHAVLPMIEDMQNVGLNIDLETYWQVLGDISVRKQTLGEEIRELVHREFPGHVWSQTDGDYFNPGSSDQVAAFCGLVEARDGRLRLDKRTASGQRFSTDDSVLSPLQEDHPFIPMELEYRELDKYEGTYLLPLQPLVKQVGEQAWRVFTHLRTTSVVSGRLSAHGPNVLAWPARTQLGLKIRSIFTAPAGYILASWDLSQVELRIAAALSKDPLLTDTFVNGKDPHTNLASVLFHIAYALVDKQSQRTPAKNINYMLLYGGGPGKLFEMMGGKMSRAECERIYVEARRAYRVVLRWLREAGTEARREGYVSDWLGRRRFLPGTRLVGDDWPTLPLRMESERQGGNFKIQGAQAELIKRAMVTVWDVVYPESRRQGWGLRFWLQVHDELFGQLREDAFPAVDKMMREALTQDSWMYDPIKIETDSKMGHTWADLKG